MDTTDLQSMREQLVKLRRRYYAGETAVHDEMHRVAQVCADLYNARGKAVAKKHGVRFKPVTASRILRQGEFLR